MYLTWAIAQLEGYLVLEMKTNAIYQADVHDFQKTERTLLTCEQSLLEPALLESSKPAAEEFADRCRIEALGPVVQVAGLRKLRSKSTCIKLGQEIEFVSRAR